MANVQTHIVECNRANSIIDSNDINQGRWTTGCNLVLEPGDRVSVEACVINSTGASSGATTLEFTGKNVTVQGEEKPYTDNTVVFEFGFYINNNQMKTVQLPVRQNMRYYAGDGDCFPTYQDNYIAANGIDENTDNVGFGSNITPAAFNSIKGCLPVGLPVNPPGDDAQYQYGGIGCYPGVGVGFANSNDQAFSFQGCHDQTADAWAASMVVGTSYNYITISSWSRTGFTPGPTVYPNYPGISDHTAVGVQNLCCNCGEAWNATTNPYPPPVLQNPIPNGTSVQFLNFPLMPGQTLYIGPENVGIIKKVWIGTDPGLVDLNSQFIPSYFDNRVVIELVEDYAATGAIAQYSGVWATAIIGGMPGYPGYNHRARMGIGLTNPSQIPPEYVQGTAIGYWHSENNLAQLNQLYAYGCSHDYNRHRCRAGMSMWERGRHYFGENDYTDCTETLEEQVTTYNKTPAEYIERTKAGGVPIIVSTTGSNPKLIQYDKCCPQQKSFGAALPIFPYPMGDNNGFLPVYEKPWYDRRYFQYSGVTEPDFYQGLKNSALGPRSWFSTNLRDYKDNSPYVLVSPVYMGPQVLPDGSGDAPKMRKMTCFVAVKISDSFTSAEDVAKTFTDAFHACNPFIKRSNISTKNDERKPKLNIVKPVYKSTPYINPKKALRCALNVSGQLPDTGASINTDLRNWDVLTNSYSNRAALYDVVGPTFTGGLLKTIPSNFMPGIDWDSQANAPYTYEPNDEKDYLYTGENGRVWNNLIYGNMAVKDINKWIAGDTLCRLTVWSGNLPAPAPVLKQNRSWPRPLVLNIQMKIATASVANPIYNQGTMPYSSLGGKTTISQGDTVPPDFTNYGDQWLGYPVQDSNNNGPLPGVASQGKANWDFDAPCNYFQQAEKLYFTGSVFKKYELIFTNIEYTAGNLDDIQFAMRLNEKYTQDRSGFGNTTVKSQNANPSNWYYNFDIGMARDDVGMNLRPEVSRTDTTDPLLGFYDYPSIGSFDDDATEKAVLNGGSKYYVDGSYFTETTAPPLLNTSPYAVQVSGIILDATFQFPGGGGGGYSAPTHLPAGQTISFQDSGMSSNYSSTENRAVTLDAGTNAHFEIKINSIEFEYGSTSFYDRLGITAGNTEASLNLAASALNLTTAPLLSDYLVETAVTNPETVWGTSYTNPHSGGGGWVFPGDVASFVSNGGTIGQFYPIDTQFIKFWFQSDTSVTKSGWNIEIKSVLNSVTAPPPIPDGVDYNFRLLDKANTFKSGVITGEWCDNASVPAAASGGVNPSRKFPTSVISPALSYKGQGFEVKYQSGRGCGIVQCFSRFLNLPTPTPVNKWYPHEFATGPRCEVFASNGEYLINPLPSKTRNIGVVPYVYTDEQEVTHELCAFQVFRDYEPVNNTNSWELSMVQFGDFFGFSPSFYDNPAIVPMNDDQSYNVKSKDVLNIGLEKDNIEDKFAYSSMTNNRTSQEAPWNKVNFSFVGAVNAGVSYNSGTNRFEISGFDTPHILSAVDQPVPDSNTSSNAKSGFENLAGVGSNIAVYGSKVVSAPFTSDLEINSHGMRGTFNTIQNSYTINNQSDVKYSWGKYNVRQSRFTDTTNQGKSDSQCGVYVENVFFCPPNWEPPVLEYGDMSNYWVPGTANLEATYQQRQKIVENLIPASAENWTGSILDKMGFSYEQIIPPYGSQNGDFSPVTNGSTNPQNMYSGTKPLILNTVTDIASNQATNLYSANFDYNKPFSNVIGATAPPATGVGATTAPGFPLPNADASEFSGLPQFQQGTVNNLPINVSNAAPGTLVAKNLPSLYASAYYLVQSDIVQTQFQSDSNGNVMNSNAIFYALKNYGAGDFYYSSGSQYWQVVNKRRVVTSITTEIRSPTTGKLATIGPNSVVLYKVQRQFNLPNPVQMLKQAEDEEMAEFEREKSR